MDDGVGDSRSQCRRRVVDRLENDPLGGGPRRLGGPGDLVAGHQLFLDVLGALNRRRVVLQIVGEFEQEPGGRHSQFVVGIAAHLVGEVHQLAVDAVADQVVHPARRPGGRVTLDHALDDVAGIQRPLECPVGEQLEQCFLATLGQHGGQHAADRRTPLRLGDALDDHPVQHLLHVLVAQHLDENP